MDELQLGSGKTFGMLFVTLKQAIHDKIKESIRRRPNKIRRFTARERYNKPYRTIYSNFLETKDIKKRFKKR